MYEQTLTQTDYYRHTEWLLFGKHQEWMGIPIKANWQTHENVKLSKERLKEQLSFQSLLGFLSDSTTTKQWKKMTSKQFYQTEQALMLLFNNLNMFYLH